MGGGLVGAGGIGVGEVCPSNDKQLQLNTFFQFQTPIKKATNKKNISSGLETGKSY